MRGRAPEWSELKSQCDKWHWDELIDACLSVFTALRHIVADSYAQSYSQHHTHWLQPSVTWRRLWIFTTALRVGGMTTREVRRPLSTKFRRLTSIRSSYCSEDEPTPSLPGWKAAARDGRHVDLLPYRPLDVRPHRSSSPTDVPLRRLRQMSMNERPHGSETAMWVEW